MIWQVLTHLKDSLYKISVTANHFVNHADCLYVSRLPLFSIQYEKELAVS